MGSRRLTNSGRTVPTVAMEFRAQAERVSAMFAPFVRESSLTFVDRIMLRRFASVIRRDAEAWLGNSVVSPDSKEAFERIIRDADLVIQVLERDSVQWSVYQREEILAIADRIARSYRAAADGLAAAVP